MLQLENLLFTLPIIYMLLVTMSLTSLVLALPVASVKTVLPTLYKVEE
jgi:hypothetical protein